MWRIFLPLIVFGIFSSVSVDAPDVTAVRNVQFEYTLSITNLLETEQRLLVEFIPWTSHGREEKPADPDLDCYQVRRHIYLTGCEFDIAAHETKDITFPVTWEQPGQKVFRVRIYAVKQDGHFLDAVYVAERSVYVLETAEQ